MMASYVGVDGFTVELLVDVRPERSSSRKAHTDEHSDAARRPVFVVGISGTKPKTRAFVTERTWADQTKSAFSDGRVDSSIKAALQSAEAGTARNRLFKSHRPHLSLRAMVAGAEVPDQGSRVGLRC
jgi:hypothetical protein